MGVAKEFMFKPDISFCITTSGIVAGIFSYFKTGNKKNLFIVLVAGGCFIATLCGKEPAQSLEDAKTEAKAAAIEIALGGTHVLHNPTAAGLHAVNAGNHLSNAIDHLREGEAEAQRRLSSHTPIQQIDGIPVGETEAQRWERQNKEAADVWKEQEANRRARELNESRREHCSDNVEHNTIKEFDGF